MRIHSRLANPEAHYSLAAASLILGRGVPCLYYGDEVGERGAPGGPNGDLAMRMPINLSRALADGDGLGTAKQTAELVRLRRSHTALADGAGQQIPLAHTNTTMAFARVSSDGSDVAVVCFNCSGVPERMTLPISQKVQSCGDGCGFVEPLNGGAGIGVAGGELHVELAPNSFRVFVRS
jgi:glycosidase